MKQSSLLLTLMLFATSLAFAQTPAGSSPKKPMAAGQSDSKPKFKAIWEPVSYKEDLNLFYVHFISKDEGWVTGAAGTITPSSLEGSTVDIATEAAGKLVSTTAISSPCPIRRNA